MSTTNFLPFRKTLAILAAPAALLVLSSCGAPPGAEPTLEPAGDPLTGTAWRLVSLGSVDSPTPVVPGSIAILEFGGVGQVAGSGGCNSFGGTVEIRESEITFSSVVSTLIACADQAVMEQETAYFNALNAAETFLLTEQGLTIFYGDEDALRFFTEPAG